MKNCQDQSSPKSGKLLVIWMRSPVDCGGPALEFYAVDFSRLRIRLMLSLPHRIVLVAGYCADLDVENAMDPSLVESMGINIENLLISCPISTENLLSVVNTLTNTLTRSGAVDVIVVDSVSD
ncbi:dna repair protein reca like protein 2 [Quercus suber]|uniref:Dna repair protein reca like protein 2 n=1 Tax=Quercus suber TaxID=58331 RepID=A0AAW0L0H8_QUESU